MFPRQTNIKQVANYDVPQLIEKILFNVYSVLNTSQHKVITPWIIEKTKKAVKLSGLFIEVKIQLPIVVTDGIKEYVHLCNQEFVFGLLCVLRFFDKIQIYLENNYNNPMKENPVVITYIISNNSLNYITKLTNNYIGFDNIEFIQEIIISAK